MSVGPESNLSVPAMTKLSFVLNRIRSIAGADQVGLAGALVAIVVIFSLNTDYFFSIDNGLNITRAISYTGIVAAITTLVLVSGGLDLSIAAVMAMSGSVVAGLVDAGAPVWLAIVLAIAAGAITGFANAFIITMIGINPLIATIGTQFVIRGIAYIAIDSREIIIRNDNFLFIGQGDIGGVPMPAIVMVGCFVVVGFILKMTVFGRHMYAMGGSPEGSIARLAGIPVRRRNFQVYIASGAVSGLAGVVLSSYTGSATGNAAVGLELPIIAAVILGGTALGGGRGSVVGTLLGVVLLGVINNGLTLHNVRNAWLFVVQGFALLVAVMIDERRQRREDQ